MRLLVTGTQGQLARSLLERAGGTEFDVVALGRPELDLAAPATVAAAIERARPDIVVNAAAHTAVDKAEGEEALATTINGAGAGAAAKAAAALRIPIVQLSTDYVFDGALERPYREDDATAPINAYGRSKLAGEGEVRAANPRHVILRTAWVYSPFGANFARTMLRLGQTRASVGVVADQIGNPTSALDLADAILNIARLLQRRGDDANLYGTFNLVGSATATWADFAEAIFAEATRLGGRKPVAVSRITTSQYPTPARRPANSRLDTGKIAALYGVVIPPWPSALPPIVARLLRESHGSVGA
jgi:dTDP-4-dehydrorhamnose reductase